MTQVNQSQMVACQESSVLEVETNQNGTELVDPGKRALTDKTVL
jgi:hypothetical protein